MKQLLRKNLVALLVCAAVALGCVANVLAGGLWQKPAGDDLDGLLSVQGASGVVALAGNDAMKALGDALYNGAEAQVATTPAGGAGTYYVDDENGDDENDGTTPDTAWKTVARVNRETFAPGDQILFKAGGVWSAEGPADILWPKGSGTPDAYIVLGSYGSGAKPKLVGNARVGEVVYLENQEYWEIRDLEITNTAEGYAFDGKQNATNGGLLGDYRGIRIAGGNIDADTLEGFHLHDLYIHSVTGECNWISGSGSAQPGITFNTGWDRSKRTGGIVFEILEPGPGDTPTTFNNILVEGNVLINNSFGGIIIKQRRDDANAQARNWASRDNGRSGGMPEYNDATWYPHTNITIQDNYLDHRGSAYACNTLYITSAKHVVVQNNVSRGAGTSAIELYYTDDTVIQYNEVFETIAKAGGADSNAIDPDKEATNALIQYNYIYNTGDGILLCGFVYGSSVVRYNVIKDAEKRYLNPHGDSGYNYIYNNIFYNTRSASTVYFVYSSGGSSFHNDSDNFHYLYNNIFYNAAAGTSTAALAEGISLSYENNAYYGAGFTVPEGDGKAIVDDPQFLGGFGSDTTLEGLRLAPTSPLVDGGMEIPADASSRHRGTTILVPSAGAATDYAGNPLYNGAPDVGLFEYQGQGDGTGTLSGYVTDVFGNLMAGATVAIDDTDFTALSGENGYYAITGVPVGTYTATISREVYLDGEAGPFEIVDTNVTRLNVTLGESTSTVGSIKGTVSNSGGVVHDVDITVKAPDGKTYTGKTGTDGTYAVADVDVGDGYTVIAEKPGFITTSQDGVKVMPGTASTVNLVLSKDVGTTEYLIDEDFSGYSLGSFNGGSDWTITGNGTGSNAITIEADPHDAGNRVMKMYKNTNAGLSMYNTTPAGAEGIVTIEARIMRTQGSGTSQFGMYSYHASGLDASAPWSSSNPSATFAITSNNLITHNVRGSSGTATAATLNQNDWYVVRNVANLDTGTFDFYVDDMNVPVLSGQNLRTAVDALDYFIFFSSTSNYGDLWVDYFRVCVGPPSDYDDAALLGLTALDPDGEPVALAQSGANFTAEVGYDASSLALFPEAQSRFATITVNGQPLNEDGSVEVALDEGENRITILVTAQSGAQSEYTLLATRTAREVVAQLTSFAIEGLTLTPDFAKNLFAYDAGATDSATVTLAYTPFDPGNTIEIRLNGAIASGTTLALAEGENTIEVEVGSIDGTNYATYTITLAKTSGTVDPEPGDYLLYEDFSGFAPGAFAENEAWGLYRGGNSANNSVTIEADGEGNQYLRLNKDGSGEDIFVYNKAALGASGVVVLEARLARTTHGSGSANQFGIYGHNAAEWNGYNSGTPVGTLALANGNVISHNVPGSSATKAYATYSLGEWLDVKLVVDLNEGTNGTFDLYVNGELVGENQTLRNTRAAIDHFNIFSSGTNYGDLLVDGICVYLADNGGTDPLPQPADKATLLALYNEYKDKPQGEYTGESWQALQAALSAAAEVLADEEATQAVVDDALAVLESAIEGLQTEPAPGPDLYDLEFALHRLAGIFTSEDGYRADRYERYANAILAGEAILADPGSYTQAQVDAAADEIFDAVGAIGPKVGGLEVLMQAARELLEDEGLELTEATRDALLVALDEAVKVWDNPAATQEEVTGVSRLVLAALGELSELGDPTALARLIAAAERLPRNLYTDESLAGLDKALFVARGILAETDPTVDELAVAYTRLLAAIDGLVVKLDYEELDAALDMAALILANADSYVASTIENLGPAYETARGLRDTATTQAQLNAAARDLLAEVAKARLKADLSRLNALIAQAEGLNRALYTPASLAILDAVLAQVKQLDETAEQKDIDAGAQALGAALNGLEGVTEVVTPPGGGGNEGGNGGNGGTVPPVAPPVVEPGDGGTAVNPGDGGTAANPGTTNPGTVDPGTVVPGTADPGNAGNPENGSGATAGTGAANATNTTRRSGGFSVPTRNNSAAEAATEDPVAEQDTAQAASDDAAEGNGSEDGNPEAALPGVEAPGAQAVHQIVQGGVAWWVIALIAAGAFAVGGLVMWMVFKRKLKQQER